MTAVLEQGSCLENILTHTAVHVGSESIPITLVGRNKSEQNLGDGV